MTGKQVIICGLTFRVLLRFQSFVLVHSDVIIAVQWSTHVKASWFHLVEYELSHRRCGNVNFNYEFRLSFNITGYHIYISITHAINSKLVLMMSMKMIPINSMLSRFWRFTPNNLSKDMKLSPINIPESQNPRKKRQ